MAVRIGRNCSDCFGFMLNNVSNRACASDQVAKSSQFLVSPEFGGIVVVVVGELVVDEVDDLVVGDRMGASFSALAKNDTI